MIQVDPFVRQQLPLTSAWPVLDFQFPEMQTPTTCNLIDLLFDRAIGIAGENHVFLRSPSRTLTYGQARARVNQISHVLVNQFQLVSGNRVLLRGLNSIDMALSWLAIVKSGMIAVGTMPLLRAKELGDIIAKAKPQLALCQESLLSELHTAHAQTPTMRGVIPFDSSSGGSSLNKLANEQSTQFDAFALSGDAIAMLAFTSGTTGLPKAAVHSYRDIWSSCWAWPHHVLRANANDVVMGSPPLAFTFGLGGLLIYPMFEACSIYFPDQAYTPEKMVELMKQVGCTICYTAPTFYRQMANFIQPGLVPSLRICVSAGEVLPIATRDLWHKASGVDIMDGIGATEMFHIFISSPPDQLIPGAIGKVVPGYVAKIVDDEGIQVPNGVVGQLVVRGPTGCKYLSDERQSKYVRDGWNYPGDAFKQDDDGYFYFQSRADDMIITSGYNVGGPEVEDALLKHPAVSECAVIGKPDAERGMIIKAICVLRASHTPSPELVKQLQDHVKAFLAPYKYPREIDFAPTLPRTETGKLQRFKLRQT